MNIVADAADLPSLSFNAAERRAAGALQAPPAGVFRASELGEMPHRARTWLNATIDEGTPLYRSVELLMRGSIKLGGRWWPFEARQLLAPLAGLVWKARAKMTLGIPVVGHDLYAGGRGEMRWKLAGLVPVMSGDGPDVTRSARERAAAEITLLPTALVGPHVRWGVGPGDAVTARFEIDAHPATVRLHIDTLGRLRSVSLQRWGNPDGGDAWGAHLFGVDFFDTRRVGGVSIPTRLRAGWYWGTPRFETDGEFFRCEILDARPVG